MIDDIVRGILSGIISPPLFQWMRKYSYWFVFFLATIGIHLYLVFGLASDFGWIASLRKSFTPVAVCISVGGGLFAVFCVFLLRSSVHKKDGP